MENRKIAIERQILAVSFKRKAKKYKVAYHYLTIQANPVPTTRLYHIYIVALKNIKL